MFFLGRPVFPIDFTPFICTHPFRCNSHFRSCCADIFRCNRSVRAHRLAYLNVHRVVINNLQTCFPSFYSLKVIFGGHLKDIHLIYLEILLNHIWISHRTFLTSMVTYISPRFSKLFSLQFNFLVNQFLNFIIFPRSHSSQPPNVHI